MYRDTWSAVLLESQQNERAAGNRQVSHRQVPNQAIGLGPLPKHYCRKLQLMQQHKETCHSASHRLSTCSTTDCPTEFCSQHPEQSETFTARLSTVCAGTQDCGTGCCTRPPICRHLKVHLKLINSCTAQGCQGCPPKQEQHSLASRLGLWPSVSLYLYFLHTSHSQEKNGPRTHHPQPPASHHAAEHSHLRGPHQQSTRTPQVASPSQAGGAWLCAMMLPP
jgi:hypothetical protein